MALVPDQKFSTFQNGGTPTTGDIIVGLRGGINTKFNWVLPAGVDTITGTADQVLVNGSSGTPVTGDVTLTLPQDIAPTSTPTFDNLILTGAAITDADGTIMAAFDSIGATGVNYLGFINNIAAGFPYIQAYGSSASVGINMQTKGGAPFQILTEAPSYPFDIYSGTAQQHLTRFIMANTAATREYTWPDASGTIALTSGASGIVNPGLINELAYYAAAGTTVSGLTTGNNGVLVTSAGGVPSISSTLPAGIAATDMDLTDPLINEIYDQNGLPIVELSGSALAVNYIRISNNPTGIPVAFTAIGSDTNIGLQFNAKAAAIVEFRTELSASAFAFITGTSMQHTTAFTFANTAASRVVTWPDADGTVAFTSSASGIVNSGSQNQLAWYAANGTTVSGLSTANDGVLVTSAGGVPSISSTLPSGIAATNMALTTPRINSIYDTNGFPIISLGGQPTPVNYLNIINNSAGSAPGIQTAGTDANISLALQTTGTGAFRFLTAGTSNQYLLFSGAGFQHITQFNMPSTAATRTVTFPDADGTVSFLTAASQSDQETGTSTTAAVTPGVQQYHASAAKAWVECGLTGNILASYNVSSVADTGTGIITPSYTVAFSSTTYSILALCGGGSTVARIAMINSYATGSSIVNCVDGAGNLADPAGTNTWNVACYGDQ